MHNFFLGFFLLAAGWGWLGASGEGRRPAGPGGLVPRQVPEASTRHDVTVTLKLIHVVVTDRSGRPVTDLRPDEFRLSDNGRAMKITDFENHARSVPAASPRPSETESARVPAPNAEPRLGRTFFFLFDLVFADPGGLRTARDAALRFFEAGLEPSVQVCVLAFSGGRAFTVLHAPDRDHGAARRAIEEIDFSKLRPLAPVRPMEEGGIVMSGSGGNLILQANKPSVGRLIAGNLVWALDALSRGLLFVPGRKIIVLCSNGLHPSYLGRGSYTASGNADLGAAYHGLCRRLSDANASVFTVNTEVFDRPEYTVESEKGVTTLREISSITGGRFLGDASAAEEHLPELEAMTASYYLLGFPIRENRDGRFHKIRVTVTRPGCEVNAQSGYFSAKPFAQYSDLEKRIQLVDAALSEKPLFQTPERFTMQALPWSANPPDDIRLVAELPLERLGELGGPAIEAVGLAFDPLDEIVDIRRAEIVLDRPEYRGRRVFLWTDLSVPPGSHKCRFVLRNPATGAAAVASAAVEIPKADPKGIMLFPPLFLEPSGPSTYLDGRSGRGRKAADSDGTVDLWRGFRIDAEKSAPLGERPLGVDSEIEAIARCAAPEKTVAALTLSAILRDEKSVFIYDVPMTVIQDKPDRGGRAFLTRLRIPRVPAGRYRLEIVVAAQGSSSKVVKVVDIE